MEKVSVPETYVHRIFVGGVFLKALNGVVEILAGIAFLFPARITLFFKSILPASFIQNPNIYFITHLKALILTISAHAGPFVVIYLLTHGVIKILLVAGLLARKMWAYPACIIIFTAFAVYQLYRFTLTHSFFLLLLTFADLLIIGLTWHEYVYWTKRSPIVE